MYIKFRSFKCVKQTKNDAFCFKSVNFDVSFRKNDLIQEKRRNFVLTFLAFYYIINYEKLFVFMCKNNGLKLVRLHNNGWLMPERGMNREKRRNESHGTDEKISR